MKLAQVFEINDDLKKCTLLTAKGALSNEVSGVEVMEVPDGAFWVKENQIIVTMGYSLKKNDITMASLIQMLIDKKACALGIKLGRFISEISQKDLDYAQKHSFPIFQIPLNLEYRQIVEPINRMLLNSEYYDLMYLKAMRRELSDLLQEKCSFNVLTDFLEKYVGKKVYIVSYIGFTPTVYENYNSGVQDIIRELELHTKNIFNSDGPLYIEGRDFDIYLEKIKLHGKIAALLCVKIPNSNTLSATDKELICEVLPIFSAIMCSNTEPIFKAPKTPEKFLSDIMKGKYTNQTLKIVDEAAFLNIEELRSRVCIAISADSPDKCSCIVQQLKNSVSENKTKAYYVRLDDKLAIILETEFKYSNVQPLMDNIERIYNTVTNISAEQNVKIAVSNICNNLKYLNYAYDEACFALGMGQRVDADGHIFLYEDYMVYRLLSEMSNNAAIVRMYNNTFGVLQSLDKDSSQDYINTITVLCENGFNVRDAANELFIHRNTMYKRIERINDILGFDINKANNRLLLSLLAKLHKML